MLHLHLGFWLTTYILTQIEIFQRHFSSIIFDGHHHTVKYITLKSKLSDLLGEERGFKFLEFKLKKQKSKSCVHNSLSLKVSSTTNHFWSLCSCKKKRKTDVTFKACVRYFLSNFYFSPNDSPSKTMKNVFYFI